MSVTSHLKDILTKMEGSPEDGDSTTILLDKIEDVYGENGSSQAQSDDSFVINVSLSEDESMYVTDKTTAETIEAMRSGKVVYLDLTYMKFPYTPSVPEGADPSMVPTFVEGSRFIVSNLIAQAATSGIDLSDEGIANANPTYWIYSGELEYLYQTFGDPIFLSRLRANNLNGTFYEPCK